MEDQPVVARKERLAEQPALLAVGLERRFRPAPVRGSARDGQQVGADFGATRDVKLPLPTNLWLGRLNNVQNHEMFVIQPHELPNPLLALALGIRPRQVRPAADLAGANLPVDIPGYVHLVPFADSVPFCEGCVVRLQAPAGILISAIFRHRRIREENHVGRYAVAMVLIGRRIVAAIPAAARGERGVLENLELSGRHSAMYVHGIAAAKENVRGHVRFILLRPLTAEEPVTATVATEQFCMGRSSVASGGVPHRGRSDCGEYSG